MKRRDLIKKLEQSGCELLRHGGKHDIYHNPSSGRSEPVPLTFDRVLQSIEIGIAGFGGILLIAAIPVFVIDQRKSGATKTRMPSPTTPRFDWLP